MSLGTVIAEGNFAGDGNVDISLTNLRAIRNWFMLSILDGADFDSGTLTVYSQFSADGSDFSILRDDRDNGIVITQPRTLPFRFHGYGLRIGLAGSTSPDIDWKLIS